MLKTVIDSLHFVSSRASHGVPMADLVAYVIQLSRRKERHPDAAAAIARLNAVIDRRTVTWRKAGPARA